RLSRAQLLRLLGLDRSAGGHVHVGRPIHLLVRLRRKQLAVGAVEDVQEAVAGNVHDYLALLAVHRNLGLDHFPGIPVPDVIGGELVVPHDLARLRTDREHRRGVEVVALALVAVPGAGIAGAPVDKVEFRIVRAGNPRARASAHVSLARLPGFVAFLARACGGIAPPELLAARGIPAVEETARAEFRARAAGDEYPVRDQ